MVAVRFLARSAKLLGHFFKSDSILSKRVPRFYGPNCFFTYLYRAWVGSLIGFVVSGKLDVFITSCVCFVGNAVGVGSTLGFYGGLTKIASIPHILSFGYAARAVVRELLVTQAASSPVGWLACVASLSFYIPVLFGDIIDLWQVFVQGKRFVMLPNGVVHPLLSWTEVDKSVALDLTVMFKTALPPLEGAAHGINRRLSDV